MLQILVAIGDRGKGATGSFGGQAASWLLSQVIAAWGVTVNLPARSGAVSVFLHWLRAFSFLLFYSLVHAIYEGESNDMTDEDRFGQTGSHD
jgi:hypothetical protein